MIKNMNDLILEVQRGRTQTLAVAAGQDPHTIKAVARAVKEGVVKAALVGDVNAIKSVAEDLNIDTNQFEIISADNPKEAAVKAVSIVKNGDAGMLMKGLVKTPDYMRAVLNKEGGLVPPGGILSHVTLVELPAYSKLLLIADAAIIPAPDLEQKICILQYTIDTAHALGIELPKAALISATETVSFKMQSSVDAAVMTTMAQRNQIQGAIVDGPLALDVALSPEACKIKGLNSPVNGEADILLFPNIETANTFYKGATLLSGGEVAAVVVGATAPLVLTSRGDSEDSKFYSIVMAAKMSQYNEA